MTTDAGKPTPLPKGDLQDPAYQRRFLDAVYRTDLRIFGQRALPIIVHDYKPVWVAEAILYEAMQFADGASTRLIVNAPPRSLKTKICSSIVPAFILGQNPSAQIICVSHGQPTAREFALDTVRIMRSPFYRRLFPGTVIASGGAEDFRTTAGGGRLAATVFGSVTGRGADFIIVDDPIKADDVNSETVRPRVNEWFDNTLRSRLNHPRTGGIALVMQRMHQADLTGHVEAERGWNKLVIPAETDSRLRFDLGTRFHVMKPGDLMNPDRLGRAELDAYKIALGSRVYDAQYLQDPAPPGGVVFKREWLRQETVERQPGDQVIQAWDCAVKTGETNDYSVCITAIVRRRTILILDVFRARLEFPDLKKTVISLARTYKPARLLIEDAASGSQLIQMLRAEEPRGVPLPIPVLPVASKRDRAAVAEARMEAGELVLPKHSAWGDEFITELLAFPLGRHDDQVDALAHIMRHTQEDYIGGAGPMVIDRASPWRPEQSAIDRRDDPNYDPDEKLNWDDDPDGGGGGVFGY